MRVVAALVERSQGALLLGSLPALFGLCMTTAPISDAAFEQIEDDHPNAFHEMERLVDAVEDGCVVNWLKVRTKMLGGGPLVRTFSQKRLGPRFERLHEGSNAFPEGKPRSPAISKGFSSLPPASMTSSWCSASLSAAACCAFGPLVPLPCAHESSQAVATRFIRWSIRGQNIVRSISPS